MYIEMYIKYVVLGLNAAYKTMKVPCSYRTKFLAVTTAAPPRCWRR